VFGQNQVYLDLTHLDKKQIRYEALGGIPQIYEIYWQTIPRLPMGGAGWVGLGLSGPDAPPRLYTVSKANYQYKYRLQ